MGKNDDKTLAKDLINSLMDDVSDSSSSGGSKSNDTDDMWNKLMKTPEPADPVKFVAADRAKSRSRENPKIPLMNPSLFGKDEVALSGARQGEEKTKTKTVPKEKAEAHTNVDAMKNDDRTVDLSQAPTATRSIAKSDETVSVLQKPRPKERTSAEQKPKVAFGSPRPAIRNFSAQENPMMMTSPEVSLAQAENLRFAQQRILELEDELEKTRMENDELATAGHMMRNKNAELKSLVQQLESSKQDGEVASQREIEVLQQNVTFKEREVGEFKEKIDELEYRISQDFKKVRVRERELENRLELTKIEKAALIRSKDETILDLKRKIDQLTAEAESYRLKCQEINKQVEQQQDQVRRTVRALRLALGNLELNDKDDVVPLRKAE